MMRQASAVGNAMGRRAVSSTVQRHAADFGARQCKAALLVASHISLPASRMHASSWCAGRLRLNLMKQRLQDVASRVDSRRGYNTSVALHLSAALRRTSDLAWRDLFYRLDRTINRPGRKTLDEMDVQIIDVAQESHDIFT
ncbi:unnamed protein product [Phaeothamnion confervicola]